MVEKIWLICLRFSVKRAACLAMAFRNSNGGKNVP
jgi:hypothetical protein